MARSNRQMTPRARTFAVIALLTLWATVLRGCGAAVVEPSPGVVCKVELHSWVVAPPHPGRHLFLLITCPPPYEHLSGRVEFTSAMVRRDYDGGSAVEFVPRVARMSRAGRLMPLIGDGSETQVLEYTYTLTPAQAQCLQRDRMWRAAYSLLGPNSTSGMRAALEDCGCTLPHHVLAGGGVFGPYPGVDSDLGGELAPQLWARFGVPSGPTPVPLPSASRGGGPAGH